MRTLHISDCHADSVLYGVKRFDEVADAMLASVEVAVARKVDLWVFNGDLCDPDSGVGVFRCVQLALAVDYALERAGIRRVWVAGNHDVCEDGSGDTVLSPLRALELGGFKTSVLDRPCWGHLGGDLHLLALPYTATSHTYDPAAFVRDTWREADGGRVLVLTHLSIEGVQPGEETKEMARGRDVLYPTDLVESAGKQVVAQVAGHYHERQQYRGIQVVGAPARFTMGERGNDPGFLVLEF